MKPLLYVRFSYLTFLWTFALVTLPFIGLRLISVELKELPFMFLALLLLEKFYLASLQTKRGLQRKVKAQLGSNASKQEVVDHIGAYKTAQDLALLANAVFILILNIFL